MPILAVVAAATMVAVADRDSAPTTKGTCLLYTSDAADDLLCVDLGGRRIIKKKKKVTLFNSAPTFLLSTYANGDDLLCTTLWHTHMKHSLM